MRRIVSAAKLVFLISCFSFLPAGSQIASQQAAAQSSPGGQPAAQQSTSGGQPLPQASTLTATVNVVNVYATVRDKHGAIIRDLAKDDFTLQDDGRSQTIRYFSRETDLPLTLGLLVDTSLSTRRVLPEEREASESFLDQMLRVGKDKAFIIHFDREVELLQDFTADRQKLHAAIALLQTSEPRYGQSQGGGNPFSSANYQWPGQSGPGGEGGEGGEGQRRGGGMRSGGTLLYDAVYLASKELMSKQQGRKALVILSDGVDNGSKETLASAVEAAQRADTMVYSILFVDEEGYGNRGGYGGMGGYGRMGGMGRHGGMGRYPQQPSHPDGKKILQQISHETGGQMFQVNKKMSAEQIYASIQEVLRNQYSLGYTPERAGAEPGYHKIYLAARQKDYIVQARDGYYSNQ